MNKEFFELVKSINPHSMNAVDKALTIKKIREMAKAYDIDIKNTQIAKIVNLSDGGLSQFLKVSNMPTDILELAKNNPKCHIKALYAICPKRNELNNSSESFDSIVRKRYYDFLKNDSKIA